MGHIGWLINTCYWTIPQFYIRHLRLQMKKESSHPIWLHDSIPLRSTIIFGTYQLFYQACYSRRPSLLRTRSEKVVENLRATLIHFHKHKAIALRSRHLYDIYVLFSARYCTFPLQHNYKSLTEESLFWGSGIVDCVIQCILHLMIFMFVFPREM